MSMALTSSDSSWARERRLAARGLAVAALLLVWVSAMDGQLAAGTSAPAIEGTCGNGVPDPGEDCDDSGDSPTCDGDCTVVECGDGYRNAMAGEQCDDQNTIDGDCCDSTCVIEPNGSACDGDGDVCNGDEICNAVGVCGPSPPPRLITEIINGTGGGGDDILAGVEGVAVDSAGNAYVVGSVSQNVFRITPAGGITEIIDATGDGTNPLLKPFDIATDAAGNVYVAGANSDNAFRVTPGGVITQIIDSTCDGSGNTLLAPHGIAVDGFGNVYVTGRDSDNAFRITPNGEITQIIDAAGDGSSLLSDPFAVATDHAGNVYVAGRASDNVFRITPGGAVTEIIDESGDGANVLDCGTFTQCDVAVDVFGNVHVSAFASDNAFRITPAGSITETIDITGDGANPLDGPHGIAADGQGSVYLSGTNSDNAFKIDPSGSIVEIIDMTGDGAGAGLDGPDLSSVAADGPGVVYVGGVFSNNVFRIETLSRALECDDGIACTLDVCDPVLGCQSVPAAEGESCDDDKRLYDRQLRSGDRLPERAGAGGCVV